jgi:AcrR family transcriptional regulator
LPKTPNAQNATAKRRSVSTGRGPARSRKGSIDKSPEGSLWSPDRGGGEGSGRLGQIYFHAARLFVENGFAATSMSEIADAVGVSKAGIYHFVVDKNELLFTLMTWGMDVLDHDVTEPARLISDPLERLVFIVRKHLINIGSGTNGEFGNPLALLLDEPAGLTPEGRAQVMERKRDYYRLVRDTLGELEADGRLIDVKPSVAAFSLLGMIVWLARWYRPGGKMALETVAEQMVEMAVRAVIRPSHVGTALPGTTVAQTGA